MIASAPLAFTFTIPRRPGCLTALWVESPAGGAGGFACRGFYPWIMAPELMRRRARLACPRHLTEFLHYVFVEFQTGCLDIFFEVLDTRSSRYRQNDRGSRQQPCQSHL